MNNCCNITKLKINGTEITILQINENDYISLTDMLKAKDGEFFISDWLRNRNTLEYLGIWEKLYNPDFNYGEFATLRNQAGLNSFKVSIKEEEQKQLGWSAKRELSKINYHIHTDAIKQNLIPEKLTDQQITYIYMPMRLMY